MSIKLKFGKMKTNTIGFTNEKVLNTGRKLVSWGLLGGSISALVGAVGFNLLESNVHMYYSDEPETQEKLGEIHADIRNQVESE